MDDLPSLYQPCGTGMNSAVTHVADGLHLHHLQSMMEDTMDEQITKLETALAALRQSVDDAHQAAASQLETLATELTSIKETAENASEVERLLELISTLEAQVGYLQDERDAALGDLDMSRSHADMLLAKASSMREAIVRYAVACGTVDVQTALLRRDPANQTSDRMAELQRAMTEEKSSSDALRELARNL
jgi:chromosome segregation ATPase